jgi:uncharacterized membrane protein (UPF0127 family)
MPFFPRYPRIELERQGAPLPVEIALASHFLARLRGLMFAAPLPMGRGLLIVPCNSIHALFMRGRIEAVFLSKDFRVLKITPPIRPWVGMSGCPGAHAVLEWSVGEAARLGVREGMQLRWTKRSGNSAALARTDAAGAA